ncbi:MAG TPA: antitoxin [Phycicoccus elongatus]|jgi:ABC-type transporter Mla subunit MlaD|uniref:antitoxin n=1 Tax=Phycicoccus TaxID=367298 RepID=UPI001DFF7505|nr:MULTISPECIES: antitoxin [Phycicoccus]MCA0321677.1 antitoxin [Actinomycetota bacterium]MCB1238049.1 antitoxin [Tetrasphaera sp.]HPF75267.1 antitoxin [Phycicoccus elongatus]HPK11825.1 antitoxin [Phycicoccus elongatus]HPQ72331.1 antitoxin [Phycicoccus elongatus]
MTAQVTDKLIAKAKELGLPPQTEDFLRQADLAVTEAVQKAGTYTDENRDKISAALDKAGRAVDEKTQGKYSDKIAKARLQAEKGIAKLAEQRTPAAGTPAGSADPALDGLDEVTDTVVPPKPTWATVDDQVRGEDPRT